MKSGAADYLKNHWNSCADKEFPKQGWRHISVACRPWHLDLYKMLLLYCYILKSLLSKGIIFINTAVETRKQT
jgi:hypothetical protein